MSRSFSLSLPLSSVLSVHSGALRAEDGRREESDVNEWLPAGWQEPRESSPPIDLTSLVRLSRVPALGSLVTSRRNPGSLLPSSVAPHSLRSYEMNEGSMSE